MKIKRVTNLSVYLFVFSGAVFFLGEKNWWPSFYEPNFFGAVFLASALLVMLPGMIFKTSDENKKNMVNLVTLTVAIAVILNALGQVYLFQLYKYGFPYDKIIHFVLPFLFVIVLAFFLEAWYGLPIKKAIKKSVIYIFIGCLLWEVYEFGVDAIFKTTEAGIYGQQKLKDTSFDILLDIAGIALASYFFYSPRLFKKIESYFRHPMREIK
ncbi:MAG: hypothetical protein HY764_03180 [Candidatus Portnoybacteria bacterium]|nr:hypothetical protein [Candidatus Portnoybacteria bacterium]